MAQNFFFSPVESGRISTGKVELDKDGNTVPVPLDHFVISANTQTNLQWDEHPITKSLERDEYSKIRSIPVRIMFDKVENNLQVTYTAFNNQGTCVCSSRDEGKALRRNALGTLDEHQCVAPDACEYANKELKAKGGSCKRYARLLVSMESEFKNDPYSAFVLRTTSSNTVRTLAARLSQYHALTGGKMAGAPMNLVISTRTFTGLQQNFHYTDLVPRESLLQSLSQALQYHKEAEELGLDLCAVDQAVEQGLRSNFSPDGIHDYRAIAAEFHQIKQSKRGEQPSSESEADASSQEVSYSGLETFIPQDVTTDPSEAYKKAIENINKTIQTNGSFEFASAWISKFKDLTDQERKSALQYLSENMKPETATA